MPEYTYSLCAGVIKQYLARIRRLKKINIVKNTENDDMKDFAVDTQFKQLRKRSLKKIQASAGFEPVTSAIPVQCSTN